MTQAIRNFAKSLESWLTNAMMNIPEEMVRVKVGGPGGGPGRGGPARLPPPRTPLTPPRPPHTPKVAAASAFAQTLRRYTSLNHLAQAARAVLQNTAQISQMLSDLNRVDFANVQVRGRWGALGGLGAFLWVPCRGQSPGVPPRAAATLQISPPTQQLPGGGRV